MILAVCSKNDEANALEPFDRHPDMVLKRSDIASFVANWQNKADNIRAIAQGKLSPGSGWGKAVSDAKKAAGTG